MMSTAELVLAPTPLERQTAVDGEGWLYDVETGEVLVFAGAAVDLVDTREKADAVLETRARIEGQILAVQARRQAVLTQLDRLEQAQRRRLDWWERRWGSLLADFARSLLTGKSRSVDFTFGRVSFRATRGSHRITNMDAAVEWVRRRDPELVKVVETTTVTAVVSLAQGKPLPFLESTAPGESVSVTTGIELKVKG